MLLSTAEFWWWIAGLVLFIFLAEGVASFVGYVAFTIITLGLVSLPGPEDRGVRFPWHGFARGAKGRVIVEPQLASGIGCTLLVASYLLFLAWRAGAFTHG